MKIKDGFKFGVGFMLAYYIIQGWFWLMSLLFMMFAALQGTMGV